MHHPTKGIWQAIKWILQYILYTMDIGLKLEQDKDLGQLMGYVDSNLVGDLDTSRSITGYLFFLTGGPIS